MKGRVVAVNSAEHKGVPKRNIEGGYLREGWGLAGDAHAGDWDRQISIFPLEALALVPPDIKPTIAEGEYSENITIEGIPLDELGIRKKLQIGKAEITICHIGKEHPKDTGRPYIVSREGRFGKVTRSGKVAVGDAVIPL